MADGEFGESAMSLRRDGLYEFRSCGDTVKGELRIDDRSITILCWTSNCEGRGHTVRALKDIRGAFPDHAIRAVEIGENADEESFQYWLHMYRKGLVDYLEDDRGARVADRKLDRRVEPSLAR